MPLIRRPPSLGNIQTPLLPYTPPPPPHRPIYLEYADNEEECNIENTGIIYYGNSYFLIIHFVLPLPCNHMPSGACRLSPVIFASTFHGVSSNVDIFCLKQKSKFLIWWWRRWLWCRHRQRIRMQGLIITGVFLFCLLFIWIEFWLIKWCICLVTHYLKHKNTPVSQPSPVYTHPKLVFIWMYTQGILSGCYSTCDVVL